MEIARIEVTGAMARVRYRDPIPAGLVGGTVTVDYSEGIWKDLTKTVVFRGAETRDVVTDEAAVTIPHEAVAEPGRRLYVGFYGTDKDGTLVIPTIWVDLGIIRDATDPSGDVSTDPSLPVYAQLAQQIGDLWEKVETMTPGSPGGGSGCSSPEDWNAAEGEPGHILNRTHYSEYVWGDPILPETTFSWSMAEENIPIFEISAPIVPGGAYKVIWNGKEHIFTATESPEYGVAIGNLNIFSSDYEDTGEDFLAVYQAQLCIVVTRDMYNGIDGSATICIISGTELVNPIDSKYLSNALPFYVHIVAKGGTPYTTTYPREVKAAMKAGRPLIAYVEGMLNHKYAYCAGINESTGMLYFIVFNGSTESLSVWEVYPDSDETRYYCRISSRRLTNLPLTIDGVEYDGTGPVDYTDTISGMIDANMKDSGGNVDYVGVEPAYEDIPKIFFGGALQQTKDEKVVPFRYISKTEEIIGFAEIKAQGNSSMSYPKKNQTVKMFKDADCTEKLKADFKGWGKQNKHVYKANWIDLTHARNVVSARLWADVVKSRANYAELPELLRTSPNQGAVDGFPVKVYADGVYQGRYTLNIPKDKWAFNMDDELDEHCVLCGENYYSGCFRAAAKIDESDWTDEIHDVVPASIKTRWNEVISFVMNSTNEEFRANLSQYFYVDSLIDYYLFGLASCGLDAFGKNQIYATYDGQRWIASMYDMDSTWGLYWNGSKFVATDYARTSYEDFVSTQSAKNGNLLYIRLEQLFYEELQTRWAELKNGALSIENIINRFERFTDIAPAELVKEDYASTTGGGKFTGIPSQSTNNIQQIRSFALARQAWTDEYVVGLSESEPEEPDIPDEPIVPDSEPLYSLAEATTFNGTSDYIDTGVQLAKEDIDFSIVFHAIAGTGNAPSLENSIFHCINEASPYPGYAFCARNDDASYKCGADCASYYTSIPLNDAEFKVVITHTSGVAGVTMKYLYNGTVGTSTANKTPKIVSVTQNLLIGCYQTVDGTKGRFWNGALNDFKVYKRVLSDDEIAAYLTRENDVTPTSISATYSGGNVSVGTAVTVTE